MKRPNILFIMADQMAAPILPLHDAASPVQMPHLMKLAEQAVVFDSAYCNSPLCAPSRFTLVSGRLPSQIGAYDNAADFPADVPTYAHYLRRLGYRTALSGKMHFCGPDQLHGYEERLTSDIYPADYGWAVNWDEPDVRASWYHNMSSVMQAGPCVRSNQLDFDEEVVFKARQYLYDHVRLTPEQPFCLTVSMTHPHDPYTIPREYWDRYEGVDIPMPRQHIEQTEQDPHSQRLLKVIDLWDKPLPEDKIRDARRAYFGACSYIDDNIGKLLGMDTCDSLQRVIERVLQEQPQIDLILATGDLSQDGSEASYQRFRQLTSAIDAPTRWLAGNHDETPPMQAACQGSDLLEPVIDLGAWRIVMLDSSIPGAVPGFLADGQLELLERALSEAPQRHHLICLHHHPVPIGCKWMDPIGLRNADALFAILDRHPQARAVLWGHVHQEFDQMRGNLRLIASPSTCVQFAPGSEDFQVGSEAPGYRWLRLHDDGKLETSVSRVTGIHFEVDYSVKGY